MNYKQKKLIFIISKDYGEFLMARYFSEGLASTVLFLLPENLFKNNRGENTIIKYATLPDILEVIKKEKPDMVFLFSGYLLVNNQLMNIKELAKLVNFLKKNKIKSITSDPFMDLLNEPNLLNYESFNLNNFQQKYSVDYYKNCSKILEKIYHLYYGVIAEKAISSAFYNPAFIRRINFDYNRKNYCWLFILGSEDFKVQAELNGEKKALALIKQRIREALLCNKKIIFISSPQIIEKIKEFNSNITWLPYCDFEKFINILLAAEYVFSWNVVSSSNLLRIIKKLPIVFFAKGHMEYYFKPVYEKSIKMFYNSIEPQIYPEKEIISSDNLKKYANNEKDIIFKKSFAEIKKLPSPKNILKKLFK